MTLRGSLLVKVDGGVVNKLSGDALSQLVNGTHTVRVEAVDPAGNRGYAETTFTVASLAPTVILTSPSSGLTNSNTSLLTYTVSEGNVVVTVDGVQVSKVSGNMLDPLPDGTHTVKVEAKNSANYSDFDEVTFTVDTVAPVVTISSPIVGLTNLNTLPLIYLVSEGLATVTIDGVVTNKSSGSTLANLSSGNHSVVVSSTDAAGNTGSAQVLFTVDTTAVFNDDTNPYCNGSGTTLVNWSNFTSGMSVPTAANAVSIASPVDGSSINGPNAIVKGAMDTTVPVNSVMIVVSGGTGTASYLAQVNGNYFAAKVPVASDTTTISAIATDQTGSQHQTSVSVYPVIQSGSVELTATPGVGIPTLKQNGQRRLDVIMTANTSISNPVRYEWDITGSGSDQYTCYSHSNFNVSYQQPGLYLTQVAVTDSTGNRYTDTAIVDVVNSNDMDNICKTILNNVKNALSNNDIPTALNYFASSTRGTYSYNLNLLQSHLSEIAMDMGDINIIQVTNGKAEYEL